MGDKREKHDRKKGESTMMNKENQLSGYNKGTFLERLNYE